MKLGRNIQDIQRKNRCVVLQTMLEQKEISRIDLSRITELNKATITNITRDFINRGVVEEIGAIEASNGRRTAGLSLKMDEVVTITLRVYQNEVQAAVCNIHGKLEEYQKVGCITNGDGQIILAELEKHTKRLLAYCQNNNKKILGIAIATLGWVFSGKSTNYSQYVYADCFPELAVIDIQKEMEKRFPGYRVIVDHDANMSALAEWKELIIADEQINSILNIVCGIGFGGGIVINGELFRGKNGVAGEVGHMGINCNAMAYGGDSVKRGYHSIFEDYASPLALRESIKERLFEYPDTILTENSKFEEIYECYERDDELAVWAVNRQARYLAYGITGLIFVLNPDVIILGDEIIHSQKFLQKLRGFMEEYLPKVFHDELDIRMSTLKQNSILKGAGISMTKSYFENYEIVDFISEYYPNPAEK